MKQNEYIDIYSHTGDAASYGAVKNNRTKKSRGILKSILCFLVIFSCTAMTVLAYSVGVYVERNKPETYSNANAVSSQDSINASQEIVGSGLGNSVKSVVGIYVYNDSTSNGASGVIISNDGYIITNDHVFAGISSPKIKVYNDSGEYFDAAFIGADKKSDIAVVKIEKLGLTKAAINKNITLGQRVYCIGCPMDSSLSLSVTQGIISGINRRVGSLTNEYSPSLIQTDAAINPGNSGGALVNENGQIVGISCSKLSDISYEGIGFAIPIDVAVSIANELIEFGSISGRAKIGITYTPVDYGQSLTDNAICGIYINSVEILSDLYGKGFGKGDTITSINGQTIKCENDFLTVIESSKPGDKVSLTITTHSGMSRKTDVILMEEKPTSSYEG